MDEQRWQELIHKRDTIGLTQEEADELGRMMAEREGRPYSSATQQEHPEAAPEEQPYSEAEVKELRQHSGVRATPEKREKAG